MEGSGSGEARGSAELRRRMRERVGLAEREQTLTSMDKAARVLHEATESAKEPWEPSLELRVCEQNLSL